jgi:hypothetical protein
MFRSPGVEIELVGDCQREFDDVATVYAGVPIVGLHARHPTPSDATDGRGLVHPLPLNR